jgi:hypothetical protein
MLLQALRLRGIKAHYREGGIDAFREAGGLIREAGSDGER